jgi:hypothetical protein
MFNMFIRCAPLGFIFSHFHLLAKYMKKIIPLQMGAQKIGNHLLPARLGLIYVPVWLSGTHFW